MVRPLHRVARRRLFRSGAAGAGALAAGGLLPVAAPRATAQGGAGLDGRIEALAPALEAYIARGLREWDIPGLAMGIVAGDRLVYAKGFGTRAKGGPPVGTKTVFQIGSTTKAFLATTLAMGVEREKLAWDDRVVELYPEFQLQDPWVTREFRVFDLLAQRSGLPPSVNDYVGFLGFEQPALIRSLRYVEPVSSFRSTFSYTNITHMLAQRIVAQRFGAPDWDSVVRDEIFVPLGMADSSLTAEAITGAPDHAEGYYWAPEGSVQVPFTPIFPYGFGGAGAINSTVEDAARWVRLHLAGGTLEGKRLVSAEHLAQTKIPRIGVTDRLAYAMGWMAQMTPNGRIVWHNGGTTAFGAYIGLLPDKDAGVIVLTNATNNGMPDAIGEWTLDRLLGNPEVDHLAVRLEGARAGAAAAAQHFAVPPGAQPAPPLGPLSGPYRSPTFGPVTATADGDALAVTVSETGARLRLEPWDGPTFQARLVPEGRFAAVAANLGPLPVALAEFRGNGPGGPLDRFRLVMADGQGYDFVRA